MKNAPRIAVGLLAIMALVVIAGCSGGEETTPAGQVQSNKAKKDAKEGG